MAYGSDFGKFYLHDAFAQDTIPTKFPNSGGAGLRTRDVKTWDSGNELLFTPNRRKRRDVLQKYRINNKENDRALYLLPSAY